MSEPLVSIIVRTISGRAPLLKNALCSLANQTYKSLEVIVIQDGGNDAESIIKEINDCSHVNIIFQACDKIGRAKAGNIGLEISNGEFIGFLDDDDELFPEHISRLATELKNTDSYDAIHAQSWETESNIQTSLVESKSNIKKIQRGKTRFSKLALMYKNYIPIQSVLFRSSLYKQLGGFDEKLDSLEDWDLWLRYAEKNDFFAISDITSIYRAPHNRFARILREKEHQKNISYIRAKQKNMKLTLDGNDIIDEYNTLALKHFLGGRVLKWWLCFQAWRIQLFGEKLQ